MKFYQHLYVGHSIRKPDRVKKKLKRYAKLPKVYVIAYNSDTKQLEFYHSILLQQWYYKEHAPYIIGIAGNEDEAVELIRQISEEAVSKTGKADLVYYLFGRTSREEPE
jgi:mannitol/fructose-specific phosphotransferase system IIA component